MAHRQSCPKHKIKDKLTADKFSLVRELRLWFRLMEGSLGKYF